MWVREIPSKEEDVLFLIFEKVWVQMEVFHVSVVEGRVLRMVDSLFDQNFLRSVWEVLNRFVQYV